MPSDDVCELLLEIAKRNGSEVLFHKALRTAIALHGENSLAAATIGLDLSDYYHERGDAAASERFADRALAAFRHFLFDNPSVLQGCCNCSTITLIAPNAENN